MKTLYSKQKQISKQVKKKNLKFQIMLKPILKSRRVDISLKVIFVFFLKA